MSKVFEIEVRRTSYITVTVEAQTQEEAETKAWVEIGCREHIADANWEIESIEEVKQ